MPYEFTPTEKPDRNDYVREDLRNIPLIRETAWRAHSLPRLSEQNNYAQGKFESVSLILETQNEVEDIRGFQPPYTEGLIAEVIYDPFKRARRVRHMRTVPGLPMSQIQNLALEAILRSLPTPLAEESMAFLAAMKRQEHIGLAKKQLGKFLRI